MVQAVPRVNGADDDAHALQRQPTVFDPSCGADGFLFLMIVGGMILMFFMIVGD